MNSEEPTSTPARTDFIPQRFWDLFLHPGRLMLHVGQKPHWWIAGLLILILNGVATTWEAPILLQEYQDKPHTSLLKAMISEEDIMAQLENSTGHGPGNRLGAVLTSGMNTWGGVIIFSLVLGFFVKLAGGKGSFWQALGIVHWASLIPFGAGSLVKLALILNSGTYAAISLSPAALMPAGQVGSFFFVLLDSFLDVSVLWGLLVIVIGFEKVFQLDRSPAILSVMMPWALATAVMAGFRLMVGV